MKKIIYDSDLNGLNRVENFLGFVNKLKGAELVSHDTLVPWEHSDGRTSLAITYHLVIQGVTLRYENLATTQIMGGKYRDIVKVVLARTTDKVGEVENIILQEAQKYKPWKSLFETGKYRNETKHL